MNTKKPFDTYKQALLALLTATVIVLQALATYIPVYPFKLTLALVPIVIGAALISPFAGAWLGFVFGVVVIIFSIITSDLSFMAFFYFSPLATIFVILIKGTLAGFAAGWVYRLLEAKNKMAATFTAAVVCPVINTGIFITGVYLFFIPLVNEWGATGAAEVASFVFIAMVGINFPIELCINLVLSPTIVRLIKYGRNKR